MSKSTAREFFDHYAADFDAIYGRRHRGVGRLINRFLRRSMLVRFKRTVEGCQPALGRTVLDVGCGPGHYGVALARAGAAGVVGIDFAPGMLELARQNARAAGVQETCRFAEADFSAFESVEPFDFVILMGFMDYVRDPAPVIRKAVGLARRKAFFSFPARGGFLAWQRRLRYRRKTDLYMYDADQIRGLFSWLPRGTVLVDEIGRDYFVTVMVPDAT